jgi:hypothetical protein
MAKRSIVFDVDGVLWDFESVFVYAAQQYLHRKIVKQNDNYNLELRYNLTKDEVLVLFGLLAEHNLWEHSSLAKNVPEVLDELRVLGYDLWALSSIDPTFQSSRAKVLQQWIPAHQVICSGFAHHGDYKKDHLRKIKPFAFVDDYIPNVNASIGLARHSFLLDLGYTHIHEDLDESAITILSLSEFKEMLPHPKRPDTINEQARLCESTLAEPEGWLTSTDLMGHLRLPEEV